MTEFIDKVRAFAKQAAARADKCKTEEATKTALVLPFLQALGYDVFNPFEVEPEFIADVGLKKGEKVDYAIRKDDSVIMLIECKAASVDLKNAQFSQLFRYFHVTKARIGILTNGLQYQFFTDLQEPNKMDSRPFLVLDLLDLRENLLLEVQRLSKTDFDLDRVLSSANDLKYMRAIRAAIEIQFEDPDEELVRFFFSKTSENGRFVQSVRDQFTPLVKQSFQQVVAERVNERLRMALHQEDIAIGRTVSEAEIASAEEPESDIVTTEEELEGFRIVRAIAREVTDVKRIAARDVKSYFGILFDDNNRKPICRLWFNGGQKYLGVFDAAKVEQRIPINEIDDIYSHADLIKSITSHWAAEG